MKTYVKLIIGAILIGSVFAFLFYLDINKEVEAITNNENNIYIFQTGVFQNKDNASSFASKFESKYLYNDDDLTRVFICLTHEEKIKDKLSNYYKESNYNYYIKKVIVSNKLIDELKNNDILLEKVKEKDAINVLCQKQLDIFALYS